MSYSPPSPPKELPDDVAETLYACSPDLLRHIRRYAEELAEYREREARLAEHEDQEDQGDLEERPTNFPDDVPSKAPITVKEINDNRYYWQWREGDSVKSKYKGPVRSGE